MVKLGKLFGKSGKSLSATRPSQLAKTAKSARNVANPKPTTPESTLDPPGPRSSQVGAARELDIAACPDVADDGIIEERDDGEFKATLAASSEEDERSDTVDMETMEDSARMSDDEQSFDDATFGNTTQNDTATYGAEDACTYGETALVSKKSDTSTTSTVKGDDPAKKYFHKDVVLNSLDDGMNNLVIRAMYFVPKPKQNDHVVVKVEAATVTDHDTWLCRGNGISKSQLPFVPGHEFVGTIETMGSEAGNQFRKGDHVAGVSKLGGGNSRFISIPSDRLMKIPSKVKSTHAVCMLHDYMAGLKALRIAKNAYLPGTPFTGMNILITDGFSPVGQAIIALAKKEGANIYCCADQSNHSYLLGLGVKCFSRDPEDWLPAAAGKFDIVIDNSCSDSYSSSWFALTPKGNLVCVGPVHRVDSDRSMVGCGIVDVDELQQKIAALKAKYMMSQTHFHNMGSDFDDNNEQYKQDLRYLMFLLEKGELKPKISEKVSLDDVPDAQRLISTGRSNGTMVCVPWIE